MLTDNGTESSGNLQPTIDMENEVNRQTGEGTRTDHGDGETVTVSGATCRPTEGG